MQPYTAVVQSEAAMSTTTETHTIEITGIPSELLRRLDERVRQCGGDRNTYIREVLEKELAGPQPGSGLAFDEIAAPLRQDFQASGMSEEELGALVEEAREEVWREQQSGSQTK